LLPDVALRVGSAEVVECVSLEPLQVVGLRLRRRLRRRRDGLRVVEARGCRGRRGRHVRVGARREVARELRARDQLR